MNTPINTKNLQTPISSIKKGPVKGLKNVLAHPHEFLWPIIRDDSAENVKNMLNELLPDEVKTKPIPWSKMRKMTKEERLALKKENQAKRLENKGNHIKTKMCFGVNEVTKALEIDSLSSILVDSTIEPLLMVKHIVTMGQNKNVPVILVPFVKTLTEAKMGFAAAALSFKKSAVEDETSKFGRIHEAILSLASELPQKKNPAQLFSNEDDSEDEEEEEEDEKDTDNDDDSIAEEVPEKPEPFKLSESVYLQRTSTKERAFVPPSSQENPKEKSWSEFISLGDDVDLVEFEKDAEKIRKRGRYMELDEPEKEKTKENIKKVKIAMQENYCPLKVKRVQGNPQRLKATKKPKIKNKKGDKK